MQPDLPDNGHYRFSRTFRVEPEDIDVLNHVNNVRYVQWVQDTAGAHWQTAIPEAEQAQYVWMVREHHIRYLRQAFLGEEIRATTWLGETRGAQSQRFVRIARAEDGAVLCEADSLWVLLDPQTGRPRRVEPEVVARLTGPC